MLLSLLELLESQSDQLTQEVICAKLGVSPSSLQSMLDILVRKGRITTNSQNSFMACASSCEHCHLKADCPSDPSHLETIYRLKSGK